MTDHATSSEPAVARGAGLGTNTLRVVEEERFRLPREHLVVARFQLLLLPIALCLLLIVCEASIAQILMSAEVLVVSGLAASQLRRRREGARRFAVLLVCVNALLLGLMGWVAGNALIVLLQAGGSVGLLLLLAARYPLRRARTFSWGVAISCYSASLLLAGAGWWSCLQAGQAYRAGDFEGSYRWLDVAEQTAAFRGFGETQRTLIALRRAELQARLGSPERALATQDPLWSTIENLSTLPRDVAGEHPDWRAKTLAWRLNNGLLAELQGRYYRATARNTPAYTDDEDPLEGTVFGDWDRLGWTRALILARE